MTKKTTAAGLFEKQPIDNLYLPAMAVLVRETDESALHV